MTNHFCPSPECAASNHTLAKPILLDTFFSEGRPSRTVNGRREFFFDCPVICHGFGRCHTCHDTGGVWRRPSPYPTWGF